MGRKQKGFSVNTYGILEAFLQFKQGLLAKKQDLLVDLGIQDTPAVDLSLCMYYWGDVDMVLIASVTPLQHSGFAELKYLATQGSR
jgi:hypothetical protein